MSFRVCLIALLVVVGCASTSERYTSSLNPWIGKPVTGLVAVWGPPSKISELPSGEKEYFYEKTSQFYEPAYGGYGMDTLNPHSASCETHWLVDKEGAIKTVTAAGSGCGHS